MCCESVELAERTAPGPLSAAVDPLVSGPLVLSSPPHSATIEAAACAAPPVERPGNAPRASPRELRDVAVAMQQHVANQKPAVLLPSSAVLHNSAPLVQAAAAVPSSAHQVVRSPRRSRLLAPEPMDAAAAQQDNGARTARVSAQNVAAARRPCQPLQKDSTMSLGDTAANAEADAPDTARASSALALKTEVHRCNTVTTASAAAPGHIARPAAEPAAVKKAPIANGRAQPPRSKSQPRAAERACAASPAAQPGLQTLAHLTPDILLHDPGWIVSLNQRRVRVPPPVS